jgi:four helix bundle protein
MERAREFWFDHETLEVYQEAIAFVGWLSHLLEEATRLGDVKDQLDRASNSIVLNIAEGNGKYSQKDRCRFLDTANASSLECAGGLDILVAKRKLTPSQIRPGKESLQKIVRMLMGLIRSQSNRTYFKSPQEASDDDHE